ncbi:MAG: hypothetical protein ACOH2P_17580 [Pseudomonas sp.]
MSKAATEDFHTLDVRVLHRNGVLVPGWSGRHWWERCGVRASIGMETMSRVRVRLHYQVTNRGQSETKDYFVQISWTPCHLGGERPWFLCPRCHRRVANLYGGASFDCRHCQGLNYRSQQANKRDVPCDRSWKLRRALGCDEGFLSIPADFIIKPKGMHWLTFKRKIALLKQVEVCALANAQAVLANFECR